MNSTFGADNYQFLSLFRGSVLFIVDTLEGPAIGLGRL